MHAKLTLNLHTRQLMLKICIILIVSHSSREINVYKNFFYLNVVYESVNAKKKK